MQPDDLVATGYGSETGGDAGLYLPAAHAPPDGVFTRDLAAGELVPVAAVGAEPRRDGADLSLSVELGDAPADLAGRRPGRRLGRAGRGGTPAQAADAERVLAGAARCVTVAEPAPALGGTTRQVLLRARRLPATPSASR